MSDEDLEWAKSVVLDLLGEGVSGEYLVKYDVSPSAIHRIFANFPLRLPVNLGL